MAPAEGAICSLHVWRQPSLFWLQGTDQTTEDRRGQAGQEEAEPEDSFKTRMEDLVVPPFLQTSVQTQCDEEDRKRRDEEMHGQRGMIILHPTWSADGEGETKEV